MWVQVRRESVIDMNGAFSCRMPSVSVCSRRARSGPFGGSVDVIVLLKQRVSRCTGLMISVVTGIQLLSNVYVKPKTDDFMILASIRRMRMLDNVAGRESMSRTYSPSYFYACSTSSNLLPTMQGYILLFMI